MPRAARRRIYCETVPVNELAAPRTVELLTRFEIDPIVAVWPETARDARVALRRFADAGLRPTVWPMVADADGRWLGAANAGAFAAFVVRLVEELAEAREVLLDLEPPIAELRAALAVRRLPVIADAPTYRVALAEIHALTTRLRAAGVRVTAAVAPPVLLDPEDGKPGWQLCLGTPVDGVAWDHVTPMLYSSIAEGWSRGLLRREDARAFVAWGASLAARRFGSVAGASLGAVGTGALGDEPIYRSPAELADDVAVATAAGVSELALFELGGVLRRPPSEAWLEAFVAPSAATSLVPSRRIDALAASCRVAGALYGLMFPGFRREARPRVDPDDPRADARGTARAPSTGDPERA